MKIKLYQEEEYKILTFILINKIENNSRLSFLKLASSNELDIYKYTTTISNNKMKKIYFCKLRNYFFKVVTPDGFTGLSNDILLTRSSIEEILESEFSHEENIAA